MLDSFLVENLLYEHMAEGRRRRAAKRLLLGPDSTAGPRRRQGLMLRLLRAASIPALKGRIERRASQ